LSKQEFGDWQTPPALARAALARVAQLMDSSPAVVLEPTCGQGSFLSAAADQFKAARLVGYELDERYSETARAQLPKGRAQVNVADFFAVDWERELTRLHGSILVTGNPPWVTSSVLGALGSKNLPEKRNFKGLSGYDALTGKSNFDVSEWMILRLLGALQERDATLAVLCKTAVARRVIEFTAAKAWNVAAGGLWTIDAMQHFNAAVDAVLFVCKTGPLLAASSEWPVYSSLDAEHPCSELAVVGGALTANAEARKRTLHVAGTCDPEWRSGLKHDCARVMELERDADGWKNGLGERVEIEDAMLFPLLKSSDVANGVTRSQRAVIVPQRALREDTSLLRQRAPNAWAYLSKHRGLLAARKSSIYRGQPDFAIFGVGPYTFAPWKVAISGLYKRCAFTLIGPDGERPVLLDDTCYFLPFAHEAEAKVAATALSSPLALDFLTARIFWDAKRPINKSTLQQLDLKALLAALKLGPASIGCDL
jgi:hypothetical protein